MKMEDRGSERIYPDQERIAWRHAHGGPLRPALVLNTSATGIALVLEGDAQLHHGGLIRMLSRRTGPPRSARIVRIEEHHLDGRRQTHLGCRWVTGRAGKSVVQFSRPRHVWESIVQDAEEARSQEIAA